MNLVDFKTTFEQTFQVTSDFPLFHNAMGHNLRMGYK